MLLPLWLLALTVTIALPLMAFLGWRVGRTTHVAKGYDKALPSSFPGEASMGALLALLGLLVAFTFSFALSRAEMRKETQLYEAMAISTAFLRAEVLEEPGKSALRASLTAYAETRLTDPSINTREGQQAFLARTMAAQAELWPTMLAALQEDTAPALRTLVISGITDVLDAHTRRIAANTDYVPLFAKIMLLSVAMAAMFFVGNNSGLRGRDLTWRTLVMSVVLSLVMIVILDFERPHEGLILINTSIMEATIVDLQAFEAAPT
jgi:hypothetical protein